MLKVGITGGIGSGKSTICGIFSLLGIPIYNSDNRAKWLMENQPEVISRIEALLGQHSYTHGKLNRQHLAQKIFSSADLRHKLEQIVHPAVAQDFDLWCEEHSRARYLIQETAILFESGAYRQVDRIIVISAPIPLRIARIIKRDHCTTQQAMARIAAQLPQDEILSRADFIITTDDKELAIPQVIRLDQELSRLGRENR